MKLQGVTIERVDAALQNAVKGIDTCLIVIVKRIKRSPRLSVLTQLLKAFSTTTSANTIIIDYHSHSTL